MPFWNNFFLMVILIWIQTGFAMVILSAALRGIPEETLEAAVHRRRQRPFQIFFEDHGPADLGHHRRGVDDHHHPRAQGVRHRLRHDQRPVEHRGAGQPHVRLDVPCGGDFGRGAAIAIVIMLAVLPIMIWNIRRANAKRGGR
jgi:alpha-glucoside transport system permease protein